VTTAEETHMTLASRSMMRCQLRRTSYGIATSSGYEFTVRTSSAFAA
jgi:hypothetical protein